MAVRVLPLVLGVGYVFLESLFAPVVDADRVTDPLWKRALRVAAILAIFAFLIVGGMVLSGG